MTLAQMIRGDKVRFPRWDTVAGLSDEDDGQPALLEDFLAVNAERIERPRGNDIIQITRTLGRADDIVHAVNYACSSLWYSQQKYPNLAVVNRLTESDLMDIDPDPLGLTVVP